MVTVSDLAAMGARPGQALVSVGAPRGPISICWGPGWPRPRWRPDAWWWAGTCRGRRSVVVSTSVMGGLRTEPDRGPLLRSGARPG